MSVSSLLSYTSTTVGQADRGGEGRVHINHEVWNHIDLHIRHEWERANFEAVGEIADSGSVAVGVTYYNYFVAMVDETLGELVDV